MPAIFQEIDASLGLSYAELQSFCWDMCVQLYHGC